MNKHLVIFLSVYFKYNSTIVLTLGMVPSEHSDPSELMIYVMPSDDQSHVCGICYLFKHASRNCVRNHVEAKHYPDSFLYTCHICGHNLKSKNCLNVHVSRNHRKKENKHSF